MKEVHDLVTGSGRFRRLLFLIVIGMSLFVHAQDEPPKKSAAEKFGASSALDKRIVEQRIKLQLVAQALMLHHDVMRSMPPPRSRNATEPISQLSWRVHLLPFVGHPELYEEFHF